MITVQKKSWLFFFRIAFLLCLSPLIRAESDDIRNKPLPELKASAEAGDFHAQLAYASHLVSDGKDKDALSWVQKAANQNEFEGQFALAEAYEFGRGVPQDYVEALKWYHKVIDRVSMISEYLIGQAYEKGLGVKEDPKKACSWYRHAADSVDGDISDDCPWNIREPLSESDKQAAAKIFKEALDKNIPFVNLVVGELYLEGAGLEQNFDESFNCFKKASESKDPRAFYRIGEAYRVGQGVNANPIEAYRWFSKAAKAQLKEGIQALELISQSMTKEEIEQARKD